VRAVVKINVMPCVLTLAAAAEHDVHRLAFSAFLVLYGSFF
jgi:hypothetical protein